MPVSVKLRLGWDAGSINVIELAQRAEAAGVAEIAVHGRTREQMYSGEADWRAIAQVKKAVSVPVIGNGDIFSAQDALRRMEESGVDGIMIARGAMGNPWVFRQIHDALSGKTFQEPSPLEKMQFCIRHYDMLLAWKPEHVAVKEMRKHISWYIHGMRGAASLRTKINLMDSPDEVKSILLSFASDLTENN